MSNPPPREHSSGTSPGLDELLLQVESLKQSNNIVAYISLLRQILQLPSLQDNPSTWAVLQFALGNALHQHAEGDRKSQLMQAIACYDAALTVYTREHAPANWVAVQQYRRSALCDLAELQEGGERLETLKAIATCCDDILTICTREATPTNWAVAQYHKAEALYEIAETLHGEECFKTLQESISCYDAALNVYAHQNTPLEWAATQNSKGMSLYKLAQLCEGKKRSAFLQEALACYKHALKIYDREDNKVYRSPVLLYKGMALQDLAEISEGFSKGETLLAALACYEDVIRIYSQENDPLGWASGQSCKGNVLNELSSLWKDARKIEALHAALDAYNAALTVYTREEMPVDWAMVQNNKGNALYSLAELLKGQERAEALQAALACCNDALKVYTHEAAPAHWATTQNTRGNILRAISELQGGIERAETLRLSIACFDVALLEYSRDVAPAQWAKTQNSKGVTLRHLARLLAEAPQRKMLREAIACFDAPVDWAMVQSNKGVVLSDLAELLESSEKTEMLERAIVCFDAALLEYRRDVAPIDWALAQSNKGYVLCDLAQLLDGIERAQRLQLAIACIDASLSVYTREVLPADHRRIAQSIGMLLFKEGDWNNAGRYLIMGLDALDDLYTLEVTAYGRQTTLITSGDLTAHLAYALIRASDATDAWQAAEVLERGRARATGEAMARQEAQLAAAGRLAPELLERFREASSRLAAITLRTSISTATRETMSIAEDTAEVQAPLEITAMSALNEQLAGYEEAREARAAHDEVVSLIRQAIPDFLRHNGVLKTAMKELRADERLAYVVSTPVGAVALLASSSGTTHGEPFVEGWWDERLTSRQVTQLLVGSIEENGKRSGGLLAAQADARRLRQALRRTMQTLGASDGVLARLSAYCRTGHARRLVFVPCGLLGLLPLHAALVPLSLGGEATEPLLDVVQVSYAPSARIWAASRKRAIKAPAGEIEALIVADPQPQSEGTPPLAGAREEAGALATLISSVSGRVSTLAGEEAILPEVLDVLRRREATLTHIHFACHGLAELADPQTSGILLAYGARLMTRDLLNPEFVRFAQLRLAVLAACQTALVGTELPDEAVGLPSAWLQAGVQGVLASLWPISDSWTVALMTKFYELHLLDEREPVEALWLAQRWLRGLPTWQEDCRRAGALGSAEGPEANKIVSRLGGIREERRYRDDREGSEGDILMEECGVAEEDIRAVAQGRAVNCDSIVTGQHWFWEDARHWAAFVMYGT